MTLLIKVKESLGRIDFVPYMFGPAGAGGGGTVNAVNSTIDVALLNQIKIWVKGSTDADAVVEGMNVADAIIDASRSVGGSPYEYVEAVDPSDGISAIEERRDALSDAVNGLDMDMVSSAMDNAKAWVDNNFRDDDALEAAVNAAEVRSRGQMLRNMTLAATGLRDIRAVMSTQFGSAMALIANEHASSVAEFDARLRLMAEKEWRSFVFALGQQMHQVEIQKIQALSNVLLAEFDTVKFTLAALQDQRAQDLEYVVRDSLWDLDLFPYASNMIAGMGGAALVPRGQTKGERFAANFMSSLVMGGLMGFGTDNVGAGLATAFLSYAAQQWLPTLMDR